MNISVIIPAINEGCLMDSAVRKLLAGGFPEVIVADGGSTDDTVERAARAGALVVHAPRGRARQMNAGARESTGQVLLFLHVDTQLPEDAPALIGEALARGASGGAFHLRFDSRKFLLRMQGIASNIRSYYAVPFGDQAIFARRDVFFETGGFREWRLMEDVEFARRLKRGGKLVMIRTPVVTSPRRYERHGFWHTVLKNQLLLAAYYIGVSPERLARFYPHEKQT